MYVPWYKLTIHICMVEVINFVMSLLICECSLYTHTHWSRWETSMDTPELCKPLGTTMCLCFLYVRIFGMNFGQFIFCMCVNCGDTLIHQLKPPNRILYQASLWLWFMYHTTCFPDQLSAHYWSIDSCDWPTWVCTAHIHIQRLS